MKINEVSGIKSLSNNENYDVTKIPYLAKSSQNPISSFVPLRFPAQNEQNNTSTMALKPLCRTGTENHVHTFARRGCVIINLLWHPPCSDAANSRPHGLMPSSYHLIYSAALAAWHRHPISHCGTVWSFQCVSTTLPTRQNVRRRYDRSMPTRFNWIDEKNERVCCYIL